MFRHFLLLLCSFVFAIQVVVIAGCGGSSSKAAASGGSGSGGGNGPSPNAASVCGGKGSGYNNQNGSVSGVWIQSPAPGQNESTVQVNANGYATVPITQWTVCLDGQPAYQTNSDATSISHSITMTAGQHLLWATVTDAKGDSNRSEVRLIQVGPAPPSSTVLPTPPGNAQVLNQMQNDSTWGICSLCAAGTNTSSNYWMKPSQSQPSLSGSSLEMYAGGQSWTNVLFMDTKLGTNNSTHFLWDFYVYHDPADEDHFWSSEFDFWQVLGGKEFMIGSQCDFGDGYWAMWDTEGDRWVLNDIPCTHWTGLAPRSVVPRAHQSHTVSLRHAGLRWESVRAQPELELRQYHLAGYDRRSISTGSGHQRHSTSRVGRQRNSDDLVRRLANGCR